MSVEEYLLQLMPEIKKMFKGESSGHDFEHLKRVANRALFIQEQEGCGDRIIIGVAGLLHDIHRLMGRTVRPKDSLPRIRELLASTNLTTKQKDDICFVVAHHEEYNWNNNNIKDPNTLIVQDADNLDAIGALGIARAFTFGGAHGRPIYDEAYPLEALDNKRYQEFDKMEPSTLHHFHSKLYKLQDNMNTSTGKGLSHKRIEFMCAFEEQFLKEWHGEL